MGELDLALMRTAFDQADDAIYITDASAVILYANEATSRITGFSCDQLVGGLPTLFASGLTSKEYYARMWKTLLSGDVWREAITNRRAGGSLYECTQTLTPVRTSENEIIAFIAVQRDMTEPGTLQYEMRAARSDVEHALEEKRILLREIVHRTKNDLGLLRSMLALQAETVTEASAVAALETAMERLTVMAQIYRIFHESGAGAPISASRVLNELVAHWRQTVFGSDDAVSIRCDDRALPERVVVSLGIIVNEIVTNTAKYARPADDAPSVNIEATFPEKGALQLTVTDNGPGLPAAILDGSDRGLGLTMIDALAQQHNGSLILNNISDNDGPPAGARVTVILRGDDFGS